MVWSSVLAMMGLPPKNRRRMYSETEMLAVAACRVSFVFRRREAHRASVLKSCASSAVFLHTLSVFLRA